MIAVLICRCGGALEKARAFLKNHGVDNWMTFPIIEGHEDARAFISHITPKPDGPDAPGAVANFLEYSGSFVIVLGLDQTHFMWSDIHDNNPASVIDAEQILEQFA